MTTVSLTMADPARMQADAVVVALVPGTPDEAGGSRTAPVLVAGAERLDAALADGLVAALVALGATGGHGEVHRVTTLGATTAPVVVAVGLGPDGVTSRRIRAGVATATRMLKGCDTVVLALPTSDTQIVCAQAEGAKSGGYTFDTFQEPNGAGRRAPVAAVQIATDPSGDGLSIDELEAAIRRGSALAESITFARDLVNTPPNELPPAALAEAARNAAEPAGITVEVFGEEALADGGYGGLVGVGQGSLRPPRLVALRWAPPGATAHVALVGKGITFDSGGLSLKPPASMETMKDDMAGAAVVAATVVTAARLRVPVAVTGWMCCAENMPSGTAIRPGDVLTMYGGKRVEVLNTDAEGRLVLADGLARAAQDNPDALVDIATLTGAAVVALGPKIAGLMGNDPALRSRVEAAAEEADEDVWAMPLPSTLRERLDSAVADIANVPPSGGRDAGMLTAGLFLQEFVPESTSWAHLDIAGPAWNGGDPAGDIPKGGTGFGVRTLLSLIESYAGS